ncbi:MAG: hypothetical protein ABI560_06360 [Myxococcales bacterium]
MIPHCTPGELGRRLGGLPVEVTAIEVRIGAVALPDYPGGPRPTSVVRVSGQGQHGLGENVAFTAEEHHAFASRCRGLSAIIDVKRRRPPATVQETMREALAAWAATGEPVPQGEVRAVERPSARALLHERAALEAAVIDLALRQAGSSLALLTGVAEVPLRSVISFAACADPVAVIRLHRAAGYQGEFKIDVDPSWDQATREALARQGGVAILDFKQRGTSADAAALSGLFAATIFEDPPPGTVHERVSRDIPLGNAGAVATAVAAGEAVNLKAPRMGGPLELLRGLDVAVSARAAAYFGGMFEVNVGRAQARQLAALFCGDAPNDLALNLAHSTDQGLPAGSSPVMVRLDNPGFGTQRE